MIEFGKDAKGRSVHRAYAILERGGAGYQTHIVDFIYEGDQPIAVLEWGEDDLPALAIPLQASKLTATLDPKASHVYGGAHLVDPRRFD